MGQDKVVEVQESIIAEAIIDRFKKIVGQDFVMADAARMEDSAMTRRKIIFTCLMWS